MFGTARDSKSFLCGSRASDHSMSGFTVRPMPLHRRYPGSEHCLVQDRKLLVAGAHQLSHLGQMYRTPIDQFTAVRPSMALPVPSHTDCVTQGFSRFLRLLCGNKPNHFCGRQPVPKVTANFAAEAAQSDLCLKYDMLRHTERLLL